MEKRKTQGSLIEEEPNSNESLTAGNEGEEGSQPNESLTAGDKEEEESQPNDSLTAGDEGEEESQPNDSLTAGDEGEEESQPNDSLTAGDEGEEESQPNDSLTAGDEGEEESQPNESLTAGDEGETSTLNSEIESETAESQKTKSPKEGREDSTNDHEVGNFVISEEKHEVPIHPISPLVESTENEHETYKIAHLTDTKESSEDNETNKLAEQSDILMNDCSTSENLVQDTLHSYIEEDEYEPLDFETGLVEIEDFQMNELQCDDEVSDSRPIIDPVEKKLAKFLKNPHSEKLEFPRDTSDHERFVVRKYVQENKLLKYKGTGNNLDTSFVVYKDATAQTDSDDDNDVVDNDADDNDVDDNNADDNDVVDHDADDNDADDNDVDDNNADDNATDDAQARKQKSRSERRSTNIILKNKAESGKEEWSSHFDEKFDPDLVNDRVTLSSLNLGPFVGVQNVMHGPMAFVKIVTFAFQVPLKVVYFKEPEEKVTIYINNIRVADGKPDQLKKRREKLREQFRINSAKNNAAKNTLCLLISKGIKLLYHTKVEAENCSQSRISSFGPHSKFESSLEDFVRKFVVDQNKIKMVFLGDDNGQVVGAGETSWQTTAILAACNKYKLKTRVTDADGEIRAWKCNSTSHTLRVDPIEEDVQGTPPYKVEQFEIGSGKIIEETNGFRAIQGPDNKTLLYEPNMVNKAFRLQTINMDKFCAIYHTEIRKETILKFLLEISRLSNVSCEFKVFGPFKERTAGSQWEVKLHINGIYIAKGKGTVEIKAQANCARNGFYFLRHQKLGLYLDREISPSQIFLITRDMLEKSTIRGKVGEFLDDKKYVKIVFPYDTNDFEREIIDVLSEKHSLSKNYEGTGGLSLWKKNSVQHKIEFPNLQTTSPDKKSDQLITKEMLSKDPHSIRDHVQNFAKTGKAAELQFDKDLEPNQRDLVELLAEKHNLKYEIDETTGHVVLSKGEAHEKSLLDASKSASVIRTAAKRTSSTKEKFTSEPPKKKLKNTNKVFGMRLAKPPAPRASSLIKFHEGARSRQENSHQESLQLSRSINGIQSPKLNVHPPTQSRPEHGSYPTSGLASKRRDESYRESLLGTHSLCYATTHARSSVAPSRVQPLIQYKDPSMPQKPRQLLPASNRVSPYQKPLLPRHLLPQANPGAPKTNISGFGIHPSRSRPVSQPSSEMPQQLHYSTQSRQPPVGPRHPSAPRQTIPSSSTRHDPYNPYNESSDRAYSNESVTGSAYSNSLPPRGRRYASQNSPASTSRISAGDPYSSAKQRLGSREAGPRPGGPRPGGPRPGGPRPVGPRPSLPRLRGPRHLLPNRSHLQEDLR